MSEGPNRWKLRLLETIDQGVDTSCSGDCHCLCLWFHSVARFHSEFVMIAQASGFRLVFNTGERSGSASNTGYGAGYNATGWVSLWGSSGCWCATTACTRRGGWSIYCPSLCSKRGGNHMFSDICNARIVQRRWGGGVLTMDFKGYGTPSLRGIPPGSLYGTVPLTRGSWEFPEWPCFSLYWQLQDFEHFVRAESGQGEGFGKA